MTVERREPGTPGLVRGLLTVAAGLLAATLALAACGGDGTSGVAKKMSSVGEGAAAPSSSTTAVSSTTLPTTASSTTAVSTTAVPTSTLPTTSVTTVGEPLPRFVDADTPPGQYTMLLDGSSTLVLEPGQTPMIDGTSVVAIEEIGVTGSGRPQWELRAVAEGATTITVDSQLTWEIVVVDS